MSEARRGKILLAHGARQDELDALLAYNANAFVLPGASPPSFPLPDERHVAFWETHYLSRKRPVFEALRAGLPQLNFPIQRGISKTEAYADVTRRGLPFSDCAAATGLELQRPELLELTLQPTSAGRIPIVRTADWDDFVTLVRALLRKGEPAAIPPSMGACTVAGFTNWHRIHHARVQWQKDHPEGHYWTEGFVQLRADKSNLQDSFILLSRGPYSNVPAAELGLDEETWMRLSDVIRRDHETTHYFTRRILSSMRNNIFDEILADYMGIIGALGYFRADWILTFFGLRDYPHYRRGGRLENYSKELSPSAFAVLCSLVVAAVENLERFDRKHRDELSRGEAPARLLMALTRCTLEDLADQSAVALLEDYMGCSNAPCEVLK